MSAEPAGPPRPRLSPFVFPSDTTFRFALLVVAVLGANLYVWNWLWLAFDSQGIAAGYLVCDSVRPALDIRGVDPETYEAAQRVFTACLQDVQGPLVWWMVGGTALLLAVATAILLVLPYWIVRRHHLGRLTDDQAPAVVDELRTLSREAELAEEPRWLWNPLDSATTGLAFGRPGSHAVALMGGLVVRQIGDPPAFRAVVRHELAHLRNRDVDLTYATLSLWYAFLLAGVLPFAVVVADEGLDTMLGLGWRLAALALLVYLTRNSVLRAREIYADVRASVPDGPQGALRRILGSMPSRSESPWRHLWRVHPEPKARLTAVDDPRRLFSLGILVAFGTGVAATIAYESLVTFIGVYVTDPFWSRLIAALPGAPLVMGVVGVGIWRGTWAALTEGHDRLPRTWPLALALAAGFLVGPQLALERVVRVEGTSTLLETAVGSGAPWIVLLAVSLVLLLSWVAASAAVWIRALAGAARPTLVALAGLAVASGVFAVFVAVFNYGRDTRSVIGEYEVIDYPIAADVAWVGPAWLWNTLEEAWLHTVFREPVFFLGVVALWLFPLGAWLLRKRDVSEAPWTYLEPGGRINVPLLGRPSREPWLVGLVAGALCLGAFLVLRLGARSGFAAETREELGFAFAFHYWQILISLVAAGMAGVVTTARLREFPLIGALGAAATVSVIATAGIVITPTVASCFEPIALRPGPCGWYVEGNFVWIVLRQLVPQGALAALAGGLVVLGVRAVREHRRVSVPRPPASVAP